jgi:hypothetical protein
MRNATGFGVRSGSLRKNYGDLLLFDGFHGCRCSAEMATSTGMVIATRGEWLKT